MPQYQHLVQIPIAWRRHSRRRRWRNNPCFSAFGLILGFFELVILPDMHAAQCICDKDDGHTDTSSGATTGEVLRRCALLVHVAPVDTRRVANGVDDGNGAGPLDIRQGKAVGDPRHDNGVAGREANGDQEHGKVSRGKARGSNKNDAADAGHGCQEYDVDGLVLCLGCCKVGNDAYNESGKPD